MHTIARHARTVISSSLDCFMLCLLDMVASKPASISSPGSPHAMTPKPSQVLSENLENRHECTAQRLLTSEAHVHLANTVCSHLQQMQAVMQQAGAS